MSTPVTEKIKSESRLDHSLLEAYALPHRVLRALRATEISDGCFLFSRGRQHISATRDSPSWTDERAGIVGYGSIALVRHLLGCTEDDAAEWLEMFALLRWPFLRRDRFQSAA